MNIRFVEEAQLELLDAISYYEEARGGLGILLSDSDCPSIMESNGELALAVGTVCLSVTGETFSTFGNKSAGFCSFVEVVGMATFSTECEEKGCCARSFVE